MKENVGAKDVHKKVVTLPGGLKNGRSLYAGRALLRQLAAEDADR